MAGSQKEETRNGWNNMVFVPSWAIWGSRPRTPVFVFSLPPIPRYNQDRMRRRGGVGVEEVDGDESTTDDACPRSRTGGRSGPTSPISRGWGNSNWSILGPWDPRGNTVGHGTYDVSFSVWRREGSKFPVPVRCTTVTALIYLRPELASVSLSVQFVRVKLDSIGFVRVGLDRVLNVELYESGVQLNMLVRKEKQFEELNRNPSAYKLARDLKYRWIPNWLPRVYNGSHLYLLLRQLRKENVVRRVGLK